MSTKTIIIEPSKKANRIDLRDFFTMILDPDGSMRFNFDSRVNIEPIAENSFIVRFAKDISIMH
jgi:hypothetical protein